MTRTYTELVNYNSFRDRFNYLKISGQVGKETFGFDRYLNQDFYRSTEWRRIRDRVILRDDGCDLGMLGYEIKGKIYIHHMNPITQEDIIMHNADILNPDFLICCSHNTHNAIHFGDENLLFTGPIERSPNDTCPWRN